MNVWLLLLAAGIGSASGVVSAVLSREAIRRSERARYRRETLED